MKIPASLREFSPFIRKFIILLIITLDFGYLAGFRMLQNRSQLSLKGVQEQVLGNEDDEDAIEYKYKMTENQLYGVIHSHVLGMAPAFFILGLLFYYTRWPRRWRTSLSAELMISLVTTFGGLWLLWLGLDWAVYIIMLSGTLMHLGFALCSVGVLADVLMAWSPTQEQNPD
jgi:hypothetical protein